MASRRLSRPVSARRSRSSTSSISDEDDYTSSDEDSIGPLPLLKRNKSLVVRRPPDDADRRHDKEVLTRHIEAPRCKSPIRRSSIDVPPDRLPQGQHHTDLNIDHRDGHAESKDDLLLLQPAPRRGRSLQPQESYCFDQTLHRRAYMQQGAATRASQSKRPDPPEQIRPINHNGGKQRNGALLSQAQKKKDVVSYDPLGRTRALDAPRQPRRSASMPLFGTALANHSKGNNDDPGDGKFGRLFAAKRCKSIAKSFTRKAGMDDDVWVERMVVRRGKDPHVFFKSVFSQECKSEPPTGAVNVVYMDELVKVQHLRNKDHHFSQSIPGGTAGLAPIVKKRSIWGRIKSKKKKSSESSSGERLTWKYSVGLWPGRKK